MASCVSWVVVFQVLVFPAKFALTFTLGSFLIQTAFAMLRGPGKHLRGMCSRDKLGSTVIYTGSMGECRLRVCMLCTTGA